MTEQKSEGGSVSYTHLDVYKRQIEEYRNKVLENAENVKYERNKRYFTEFAQKAQ